MSGRKLLVLALSALAVLGPAGLTASASPTRPLGQKNFTGSAGAHYFRCFRKPPARCRGPRGLRGLTGKTGAAGGTGAAGQSGLTGAAGLQGLQGVQGSTGTAGSSGPSGSRGPTGATGATGAQGLQGIHGDSGPAGSVGPTGSRGPSGLTGSIGPMGPQGTAGVNGSAGSVGPTGATGPPGSNAVSQYAYIYNVGVENVFVESDVTFDSNGVMTSGITHAGGSAGITLLNAGTYKVTFSVSGTEASQFALFVNGTLVAGSIYGSGAATQQNAGQAIFTVVAGGVLTLRNHTSNAAVGLPTIGGGTQANTNASIAIEKLT